METPELRISIDPEGNVLVDVDGVKGKGCADLVSFLEDALGKAAKKKLKADYYERDNLISGTTTSSD